MCCCSCNGFISDIFLVVLSVLFPPLPVWIRRGICSCDSVINICLFLLGYFPGLIHSWYIIAKYPPYSDIYYVYRSDLEHQTPRHVVVHTEQPRGHSTPNNLMQLPNQNYGAIDNNIYNGSNSNNHLIQGSNSQSDHTQNTSNPPPYTEFGQK